MKSRVREFRDQKPEKRNHLQPLQHPHSYQLLLDMPFQDLRQEFSKISSPGLGPLLLSETINRRTKHFRGHSSRLGRYFRRSQPLVRDAHQTVGQGMIKSPTAIQHVAAHRQLAFDVIKEMSIELEKQKSQQRIGKVKIEVAEKKR